MAYMDIRRQSRRGKSLSFSESFSDDSSISDDSSLTAAITSTPLRYLGIPFSWEQVPGIPKKNTYKNNDQLSQNLLPLPPSGNATYNSPRLKKSSSSQNLTKDPFVAAFIECSKDKKFETGRLSKTPELPTGDRVGFVVSMYTSCKRTCAVTESIVYRRRPSTGVRQLI